MNVDDFVCARTDTLQRTTVDSVSLSALSNDFQDVASPARLRGIVSQEQIRIQAELVLC
jgi:hypothetical protein